MNTITLNNGNRIPVIGLGTFKIKDNDAVAETVSTAIEAGYCLIDTAFIYGNEEGVGRGIRDSSVDRSRIFVTTKIWNEYLRSGKIREAAQKSIEILGTDYIDLLLTHWPAGDYKKYWSIFEELVDEGLVKNIGVSNFTIEMLEEFLPVCRIVPVMNQVELHPFLTQKPLLNYCREKGITLTAWAGFMAGKLLDNPEILKLALKYGKTAAQVIQRWHYQNGVVTIPKSTNPVRMKENMDIFDFSLSTSDMNKIDSMNRDERSGPDPCNFDF